MIPIGSVRKEGRPVDGWFELETAPNLLNRSQFMRTLPPSRSLNRDLRIFSEVFPKMR
jgi:hypothetical protein